MTDSPAPTPHPGGGAPTIIREAILYPTGVDPLNPTDDAESFAIRVKYRGQMKWIITKDDRGYQQMTHTGRWLYYPRKMTQLRWCRFDFDTALELATTAVDKTTVHGLTYAEWAQFDHVMTADARALIRERTNRTRE